MDLELVKLESETDWNRDRLVVHWLWQGGITGDEGQELELLSVHPLEFCDPL